MQNVLGMYSKCRNYQSNSGNNIKPHGGDPTSFSLALRTWMPMKQSFPGGHFDSARQEHLYLAGAASTSGGLCLALSPHQTQS